MFCLQCWISFCSIEVIQLYTHTHTHIYNYIYSFFFFIFFSIMVYFTEYSSLCCTVGPCCLSILCIVVCIPGGSVVESSPANAGVMGSVPGLGRSPGGRSGNPLQYACLGNPVAKEPGGLQSVGS